MSTGSDHHELVVEEEELLKYLSLLSGSQGAQKINFSKALEKIYSDHFANQKKNIGQAAFEDEWMIADEIHSFQQSLDEWQKSCGKLKEIGKSLEKAYKELSAS